jgi:hypothetical protein
MQQHAVGPGSGCGVQTAEDRAQHALRMARVLKDAGPGWEVRLPRDPVGLVSQDRDDGADARARQQLDAALQEGLAFDTEQGFRAADAPARARSQHDPDQAQV